MQKIMAALVALGVVTAAGFAVRKVVLIGRQDDGTILLPTGQKIKPRGRHIAVKDRPLGMALSPDGASLAVVTGSNFTERALHIVNVERAEVVQTLAVKDSFAGVAYSPGGDRIFVGGGQSHEVLAFRRSGQRFVEDKKWKMGNGAPSGLAVSRDGRTVYVALNLDHALGVVDTVTGSTVKVDVGSYPYTVAIESGKVYVSNWGGRRPREGDRTDGVFPVVLDARGIPNSGTVSVMEEATRRVVKEIAVGLHPSGMCVDAARRRLYVANANSDSISVIDTQKDEVIETIAVGPDRKAPLGSAPNALAVSRDGKTLYVANAANNAVAVVDVSRRKAEVKGFLPTGWFPTAVTLTSDEKRLFVASGYGFGSIAPAKEKGRSYKDREGVISLVDIPRGRELAAASREVASHNRAGEPVPMRPGDLSPIRHVFYIIKENRTYDQLFGDLKQANGDESLVHFGREVTPNHHALVERYTILDNFYAPGDQSALGHRWCTQGYASDWVHKYSNARNDQNPMLFAPTDFLWDNAKAHGVSVRSYGERGLVKLTPDKATWTDVYRDWKSGERKIKMEARTQVLGLKDIYSPDYPGFSMTVPDQVRADIFLRDLREFEKNGNLPRLVILLLPADHTDGTAAGFPTPRAMVADNDLALGRIVEAISRSRYWKESAIFVVEDDAQNGVDHVDGHRTVGMVLSPWVKRKTVDSTFYTTINMYRTIEQILGLPPTNQFDLAAEPMFSVFTREPDFAPYAVIPNRVPLDEMNPALKGLRGLQRELAAASAQMDFDEPDEAPEDVLNRAIWHSVKGYAVAYPGRR